ncbi:MAG: hypothetical protein M1268_01940 [Patescibacteria group bacterium]|nr:hypothetical protein [Patescibacteria group bacterium]
MKTEKIVLSFIAVAVGIIAAGIAFYLYQSTKTVKVTKMVSITPPQSAPTQKLTNYLTVDSPKDEEVVDKRTITVSGKTMPDDVIVISAPGNDLVIRPAQNGNFTTTLTIQEDENSIEITSIAPNGEQVTVTKTVTYSTENF